MSSLAQFHYDPFFEFDRLFGDPSSGRLRSPPSSPEVSQPARTQRLDHFHPRLDLYESQDSDIVVATFELPGLKPEDVTIAVHYDRLTVSGESVASNTHERGGYAVRERPHGRFSRALQLPVGIKPDDVKAKMEHGLLTLTFPKAIPEQQPHRIAIQ